MDEISEEPPMQKAEFVKIFEKTDLTKYALVATKIKNGVVLMYEFMPVQEGREFADGVFNAL